MSMACGGAGAGPAGPGDGYDPRKAAALARRARTDPRVRRICEHAGRFVRVGLARRRERTDHGVDEVVGVTLGDDLARLTDAELTALNVPGLRLDLYRRLVERQAVVREFRGVEYRAKGPAILVVDESGSMGGDKIETAKGLCLAMAWLARTQRRWVGLVAYSGDSGSRLLALTPGAWPDDLVADWMSQFIGRGSWFDVPVREMPRYYDLLGAPQGRTDVVFFTDAICAIPEDAVARFNAWRARVQARVTTVLIEGEPGDLRRVSDDLYQVPALTPDSDAVGAVLLM
jgi:uncharacterized protein with von Willebrand factor type A (vWA) domain